MTENAALFVDIENFYIGREENHDRQHPDDDYEFAVDLDLLVRSVKDLLGGRRLTVARAYANFNDRRPGEGDRRWDYYLQSLPRALMEQGVEPIQVFRFPGGSNKNAADMRMALDAVELRRGAARVATFVFVTGDSDFLPLVMDLRRDGAEVIVIGVQGSTKPIFSRYCDRFEYFEDLAAARQAQEDTDAELGPIRAALAEILARRCPLEFAAVKPLLSEELGEPFDALRFHCETTGDFLRRFASRLGVVARKGEHDWELLTAEVAAGGGEGGDAGDGGREPRPLPAADGDAESHREDGGDESERDEDPAREEALYRDLLKSGNHRCYLVEPEEWRTIVREVFAAAGGGEAPPPPVLHRDLVERAAAALEAAGFDEAPRKANDALFQVFKAGCFCCAEEGAEPDQRDFHWSREARLADEIRSPLDLSERTWAYLVELLERRLEQRGVDGGVRIEPLARLLLGKERTPEEEEALRRALERGTTR